MRAVLQRVTQASVTVDGETLGFIGRGLLVLLGVAQGDGPAQADQLATKIAQLRLFADAEERFSGSLLEPDSSGQARQALVVSQFTLLADVRKGRRPSFTNAAAPEIAAPLIERFAEALRAFGVPVATGRFGAHMLVTLQNDGPVTLVLDTAEMGRPRRS